MTDAVVLDETEQSALAQTKSDKREELKRQAEIALVRRDGERAGLTVRELHEVIESESCVKCLGTRHEQYDDRRLGRHQLCPDIKLRPCSSCDGRAGQTIVTMITRALDGRLIMSWNARASHQTEEKLVRAADAYNKEQLRWMPGFDKLVVVERASRFKRKTKNAPVGAIGRISTMSFERLTIVDEETKRELMARSDSVRVIDPDPPRERVVPVGVPVPTIIKWFTPTSRSAICLIAVGRTFKLTTLPLSRLPQLRTLKENVENRADSLPRELVVQMPMWLFEAKRQELCSARELVT